MSVVRKRHGVLEGFDEVDTRPLFAQVMTRLMPGYPSFHEQLASGSLDDDGKTALREVGGGGG